MSHFHSLPLRLNVSKLFIAKANEKYVGMLENSKLQDNFIRHLLFSQNISVTYTVSK